MTIRVSFLGATETVTGSRYLVETGRSRILVDCGLFQGLKKLRLRNWSPPSFDPASLDAVVLTHAHIDHSGYLPRLHSLGYRGPVYCTPGTGDLIGVLLPDSGYLQEEEARLANKLGHTRHHPALPLYTRAEAEQCLKLVRTTQFHDTVEIAKGIRLTFTRAGHILGSSCVSLQVDDARITFTGDVGRPNDLVMRAPEELPATDWLVTESTYGDRVHPSTDVVGELARVIDDVARRHGILMIPAFAVGRVQSIMHILSLLRTERRVPDIPAYLDSPLAIDATDIYCNHAGEHRLSASQCQHMSTLVRYIHTPDQSKALAREKGPMIIIAASGMATGGRILHHLKNWLPDEHSTVFLVGYQSPGTRGRAMLDGADRIKIHGQYVRVRAHVEQIQALSAHADYTEMTSWFKSSNISPRRVFVTHGEPQASDTFRRHLSDTLGWNAVVPEDGSCWHMD